MLSPRIAPDCLFCGNFGARRADVFPLIAELPHEKLLAGVRGLQCRQFSFPPVIPEDGSILLPWLCELPSIILGPIKSALKYGEMNCTWISQMSTYVLNE